MIGIRFIQIKPCRPKKFRQPMPDPEFQVKQLFLHHYTTPSRLA